MKPSLHSFFAPGSRLAPNGRLEAATLAIQRALQSASLSPSLTPPLTPPVGGFADPAFRSPFFDRPLPLGPAQSHDDRFTTGRHSAAGLQRDYKLFIPTTPGEGPRPLVVMLHGCKQNPDDFAAGTAINAAAEAEGFYVLYPSQSDQANPQRCWNWFKHNHQTRDRGETALIAHLARTIAAQHPIDADRIYIAGLSAGGAMAALCGAAYPDVFAAVGVHSGLPAGLAADLPSALAAMRSGPQARASDIAGSGMPTIVLHGDADGVVHPSNADGVFEHSVGSAADIQIERVTRGGRACTRRFVCAPDGQVLAEQWRIQGAAHAWSGGSASGSYTDARGPSATGEMLRFFRSHRRAASS
jgi:poly(hydroxyalkanoate) depolymerase family esterase